MLAEKKEMNNFPIHLEKAASTTGNMVFLNIWIIVFMCFWVACPYVKYKLGFMPFFALIIVWFFTSDYRWIFRGMSLDLVMFFVWILSFVPYLLTGTFQYGPNDEKNVLISFMLTIGAIVINHYYMYYNRNVAVLGKIAFFTILAYLIASIQTFAGLKVYPEAARDLATGSYLVQESYFSLGIGGFSFVYSAVFLNILLLYFVTNKTNDIGKVYRYFCLAVFIMITIMLVEASYAISLLFMFTGLLLVVMIKGKKSFIVSIFLAVFFILLFPKELIGYFLIDAANLFQENELMHTKFLDLAMGFVGDSFGGQTVARGDLYLASLESFLRNPLFGIYGPFGNEFNSEVGGHSGWFDLMAYYGLFGSLPFFAGIFLYFRKQLLFYSNHPYYRFLLIVQILFLVFGFINPVIYTYQIGFILFAIAPALPFLPYAFGRKSETKVSESKQRNYTIS